MTSVLSFRDVSKSYKRGKESVAVLDHFNLVIAENDFDAFRRSVATWFDDSMDRLSGAYKRHMKLISIIVGCAVAVLINADTFEVGNALWKDGGLRAQMVQAADAAARGVLQPANDKTKPPDPTDIATAFKQANETLRPLPIGWPPCTAKSANGSSAASPKLSRIPAGAAFLSSSKPARTSSFDRSGARRSLPTGSSRAYRLRVGQHRTPVQISCTSRTIDPEPRQSPRAAG